MLLSVVNGGFKMVIPTYVLIVLLIILIWCLQLNLSAGSMSDESKLENIQRINITLVIVILCYICLFVGKVVL